MFPKILKKKSVIMCLAAAFVVSLAFMAYGFVPVISVNGESAGLSHFLKVQSAVTSMDKNSNNGVLKLTDDEVKERVFGNIIDKVLLDKMIRDVDASLEAKAREKVEEAIKADPNLRLEEAARKLYGLSAKDFTELVLLPMAKRNLLAERFEGNQEQLNKTWEDLVDGADIKIYYPGYYWENGEIKKK